MGLLLFILLVLALIAIFGGIFVTKWLLILLVVAVLVAVFGGIGGRS